jgi:hypothetical protein
MSPTSQRLVARTCGDEKEELLVFLIRGRRRIGDDITDELAVRNHLVHVHF